MDSLSDAVIGMLTRVSIHYKLPIEDVLRIAASVPPAPAPAPAPAPKTKRPNKDVSSLPSITEIQEYYTLSQSDMRKSWLSLKEFSANDNVLAKDLGMLLINHYFKHLTLDVPVGNHVPYTKFVDDPSSQRYKKLLSAVQGSDKNYISATVCNYLFINPITMFYPSTAKWFYKKYGASSVLDPCAGWGGRMLGAMALGVPYTGFDTNVSLHPIYSQMVEYVGSKNATSIASDCLQADFSKHTYDCVLTSPPYGNKEMYNGMKGWDNDHSYIREFLAPLWLKCMKDLKQGGVIGLHITKETYTLLLKHDIPTSSEALYYKPVNSKGERSSDTDMIYVWHK